MGNGQPSLNSGKVLLHSHLQIYFWDRYESISSFPSYGLNGRIDWTLALDGSKFRRRTTQNPKLYSTLAKAHAIVSLKRLWNSQLNVVQDYGLYDFDWD